MPIGVVKLSAGCLPNRTISHQRNAYRMPLTKPFRFSLRTRLVTATIVVFLLGIWSLTLYVSQMLRKGMESLLGEQQFSTASMVANQINSGLETRLQTLEKAAADMTEPMRKGVAAVQSALDQRQDIQAAFNGGSYVVDAGGTAIADYPLSSERVGINYLDREYVVAPLKEGRPIIGTPIIGKKAKAPVIVMAAPIRNADGLILGAIAGVTKLDWPNFLDQISQSRHGKTGGFLMVVPQRRLIAVASDKRLVIAQLPEPGVNRLVDRFIGGYEGAQVGIDPQGKNVLASAKYIPATGWYVAGMMMTTA